MTLPATPSEDLAVSVSLALEGDRAVYLDADVPCAIWASAHWQAWSGEVGTRAAGAAAREEQPFWREHPVALLQARVERGT